MNHTNNPAHFIIVLIVPIRIRLFRSDPNDYVNCKCESTKKKIHIDQTIIVNVSETFPFSSIDFLRYETQKKMQFLRNTCVENQTQLP